MENNEARYHKPKDEHEKQHEDSHQVKIQGYHSNL
jgi:hypothetical protein